MPDASGSNMVGLDREWDNAEMLAGHYLVNGIFDYQQLSLWLQTNISGSIGKTRIINRLQFYRTQTRENTKLFI